MKKEIFKKLEMSFSAFGMSVEQLTQAMEKLSSSAGFSIEFQRQVAHRRRCVVIAMALSKAPNHLVKRILWNLFLHA